MKKYLVAFFVLISLSTAAQAQYSSSWIGVRVGANIAGESIDPIDPNLDNATSGLKFGILGGVQYDHWFGEMWGFGVGLLFDQKGTHEDYPAGKTANNVLNPDGSLNAAYIGEDNDALNYLEIPIVLKLAFGDGDVKPYLFAGPSIGILLSASNATTGIVPPIADLKSHLNATDISISFGAGLSDKLNSGQILFFDVGYAAGLTKIYKDQPDRTPIPHPVGHTTSKSGDIRITIGMMWELK